MIKCCDYKDDYKMNFIKTLQLDYNKSIGEHITIVITSKNSIMIQTIAREGDKKDINLAIKVPFLLHINNSIQIKQMGVEIVIIQLIIFSYQSNLLLDPYFYFNLCIVQYRKNQRLNFGDQIKIFQNQFFQIDKSAIFIKVFDDYFQMIYTIPTLQIYIPS
ncbi:unnamed protein product [Paramecium pentaurelia]|uniref:Uncharacterized protein n=1 Tax=Paramecium pentaurelia TaxID=43138 RepID=A0A8S1UIS3_9CILI|nr:unnamed protein product [Paramecium pentaurelia]